MLLFLCLMMGACRSNRSEAPVGKLKVVATVGMIYDAVRVIGRDSVEVTAIMGPGVDPHIYKATPGDLEKLSSAHLILYNGLFLEGKMGEVLEQQSRLKAVRAIAEAVEKSQLLAHPKYEDALDPHIWFDVQLWKRAVAEISQALQEEDIRNHYFYQANTATYLKKLDSLDKWVRDTIEVIEPQHRVLVTAHDAFGYFGRAYGIEVRAVQGLSTQADFGLRDITDLVEFVVERGVPSVFVETSVSERSVRAIVEGAEARGHHLRIGGSLYSDAMGAFGTEEGTYIGMFRANVRTIVHGLTWSAPKKRAPLQVQPLSSDFVDTTRSDEQ